MTSQSFRREVLKFALDGDSVQNLLRVAASDWSMERQAALDVVAELARQGLLTAYERDGQTGQHTVVDAATLNLAHLDGTSYTFLLRTERTIPGLAAFEVDRPLQKSA